jgi:hypothetical protein
LLQPLSARARAARRCFSTAAGSDASTGGASGVCARQIDLKSRGFLELRRSGGAYVDKTSAIADVLAAKSLSGRAFFSRFAVRFGKSLTLAVMAELLASGSLPEGVQPWRGFKPVNREALFGGLGVYRRWQAGEPQIRQRLEEAHFVIKLPLGDAQTGAELKQAIIDQLADIAGAAFGPEIKAGVARRNTPGSSLRALIATVPEQVPVAILLDEYDAAIISDVTDQPWHAANRGVAALRSLMMATKAQGLDDRIRRFIVTGVARFARASLLAGANNFADLTAHPAASRMLGFTEQEIRESCPRELARLGQCGRVRGHEGLPLAGIDGDDDVSIRLLEHWYNGYCFDGSVRCYNRAPVLASLAAGEITGKEMGGAAGSSWLGLTPSAVLAYDFTQAVSTEVQSFDVADLQDETVNPIVLLLQTGLLTLQHAGADAAAVTSPTEPRVTLLSPNEYARRSLQCLVARMTNRSLTDIAGEVVRLRKALAARDREAFGNVLRELLQSIPQAMARMKSGSDGTAPPPREAPYHACLFGFLRARLPPATSALHVERQDNKGNAHVELELKDHAAAQVSIVWVLELGVVPANSSTSTALAKLMEEKLEQAKGYFKSHASLPGAAAGIVVDRDLGDTAIKWKVWDVAARTWT